MTDAGLQTGLDHVADKAGFGHGRGGGSGGGGGARGRWE